MFCGSSQFMFQFPFARFDLNLFGIEISNPNYGCVAHLGSWASYNVTVQVEKIIQTLM